MPLTDTPLRRARESVGWTQRQLAAASGVTQAQICKLERGQHQPGGMRTAQRLATALGVSLDALWGTDGPTPAPTHRPVGGAPGRSRTR